MAKYEISHFFSNEGSRNEVRMRVIEKLSTEIPGTGSGDDASRYIYYVSGFSLSRIYDIGTILDAV